MNWSYVLLGLVVTLLASVMGFIVEREVPNYDDPDEIPAWAAAWIYGVPISLLVGWIAS